MREKRETEERAPTPMEVAFEKVIERIDSAKAKQGYCVKGNYSQDYISYMEGRVAGLMEAASVVRKELKADLYRDSYRDPTRPE